MPGDTRPLLLLGALALAGACTPYVPYDPHPVTTAAPTTPPPSPVPTSQNANEAGRAVDKVSLSTDNLVLAAGTTQKLLATVSYLDGSKDANVSWSSRDTTIATVNTTTGEVVGVAPGSTSIVAAAVLQPGKSATVTVTVK